MSLLANEELTKPQKNTLREIQKFIDQRGFPPTVEELATRMKLTKATVHGSLDRLIQKGFLRRTHGKARSIEIVRVQTTSVVDVVEIPLLGEVPAGFPLPQSETIKARCWSRQASWETIPVLRCVWLARVCRTPKSAMVIW